MTDTENTPSTQPYTDAQATDEAVLLLVRRLRRMFPHEHAFLIPSFPEGVQQALTFADQRADMLRAADQRNGVTRVWVDRYADMNDEGEDESGN